MACTETTTICTTCTDNINCECKVLLSTDCITYTGDDLPCSGIKKNTIETNVWQQMDAFICRKFTEFTGTLSLISTGIGAKIYKGIDPSFGYKQIRSLTKTGNLITVTENIDDIGISINETNLSAFVKDNQTASTAFENIASLTGVKVYKGLNTSTNINEFRTITQEPQSLGGQSVVRDFIESANDIKLRVKPIVSDSLIITATDTEVRVEAPTASTIPAIYVNSLYIPTYKEWLVEGGATNPLFYYIGEGKFSKPFTNSIKYTSPTTRVITPDTAIGNALSVYLGDTAQYSRLLPQRTGEKIIIQDNNTYYQYSGDFNYNNINIEIQGNVSLTTANYIIDMDNPLFFDGTSGTFTITIKENATLQFANSLGFRNSGNTQTSPPQYDTGKTGKFLGDGLLYTNYNGNTSQNTNRYVFNGDGNNNDGIVHFQVYCKVRADYTGIYNSKNKNRIDFYNVLTSGTYLGALDTTLRAFNMTGGQIRFYEKGGVVLSAETSGREYGFTFEPSVSETCIFQLNKAQVSGNSVSCFARLNNGNVNFLAFNSPSGDGFSTTTATTTNVRNGLFENLGASRWSVTMKNCVFSYTGIDHTKVDLTGGNQISVVNFIGNNIVENLLTKPNRLQAINDGIPLYSAYLKTGGTVYPNTATWSRDIVLPD